MSWDDDEEWDADDIEAKLEAQLKAKEKAKRVEEGLESSSEEEEAPKPKAEAQPKPKPKAADKKGKAKEPAPPPQDEGPRLSPEEEKIRKQKLVEEADARLANDLFSGCEKSDIVSEKEAEKERLAKEAAAKQAAAAKPKVVVQDLFDKVELKVQADVERLCETCINKLSKSQTKGVAVKFLADLIKQLEPKLDLKELAEVDKLLTDMVKDKKVMKGASDAKANKANTKLSKTTKFNTASEWEEVYGGGEGDEEWTQEEWDEWYKTQETAGK
mmetsp:Transcript_90503/g.292977  ORF Transcript_90503/g.292977 Transcript_90503/m.292977 type:complete len:272 (+) Transcript_90503:75-890(+)